MFDAKNERTEEKEKQNGKTSKCGEALSEQSSMVFDTAADIIVDIMLKEAFAAHGIENNESYTRFDLAYGIRKLEKLSNAKNTQFGGAA